MAHPVSAKGCPTVSDPLIHRLTDAAIKALKRAGPVLPDTDAVARIAEVDPEVVRSAFPTDAELVQAIGTAAITRLTNDLFQRLSAVPMTQPRAAGRALCIGYIRWACNNPDLYHMLVAQSHHTEGAYQEYRAADAAFRAVVDQLTGESPENPGHKSMIARSVVHGLADLLMSGHADIWARHGDNGAEGFIGAIELLLDFLFPESIGAQQDTAT